MSSKEKIMRAVEEEVAGHIVALSRKKRLVALYYLEQATEEDGSMYWYLLGTFHRWDSGKEGTLGVQLYMSDYPPNCKKDQHTALKANEVTSVCALNAIMPNLEHYMNYAAVLVSGGNDLEVPIRVKHNSENVYNRKDLREAMAIEAMWNYVDNDDYDVEDDSGLGSVSALTYERTQDLASRIWRCVAMH
jgi:hypothetical protein